MLARSIYKRLISRRWTIGFVKNSIKEILQNESLQVDWIKHNYKDRWFADPFILDITDSEITVLVEEFYYPIDRGRIALLIIDKRSLTIKSSLPILTLPTHLSYPAILRKNDKIYIYPESGESGFLKLYELDEKNNYSLKEVATWSNEFLADATLVDDKTIFATVAPNYNKNILGIYEKDNQTDLFQLKNTVIFNENIARMAGDIFEYHGKKYRPAQESNKTYGHACVIQEMIKDVDGKFSFKEIRRLYSTNPQYTLGLHTLNMYKDMIVVDVVGYRYPLLASFIEKVKRVLKR